MSFSSFTVTFNDIRALVKNYTCPVKLGGDLWNLGKLHQLAEMIDGYSDGGTLIQLRHCQSYQYEEDGELVNCPTGWYLYEGNEPDEGFFNYIPDDASPITEAQAAIIRGLMKGEWHEYSSTVAEPSLFETGG